jgi:menaquinone-9 beta-reductase
VVEVLVIGAGPAGSAAAIHLARAGREVLLLDRCRFPRIKPCGEYYNPEAVRLLRELGVLPALLTAGARSLPELRIGAAGCPSLTLPFKRISPAADDALSVGREVLDALLVEEAVRSGAAFQEEALVREPLTERGEVCGALVRMGGVDREIRARITLAADGLRSRFARRLGLAGSEPRRRKLGITARYRTRPGAGDRIEMLAGDPGCCGLSLRGEEANLGMVADASRAREIGGDPGRFFGQALRGFDSLEKDLEGDPLEVRTVGPLTWTTRRQSTSGCLLLGDAAGFYDPFTGQGVTFALLTAKLAAEVAAAALEGGDVSAARLAEYETRRRRMIEPRVWVQQAIQSVIERPRLLSHVMDRLQRREETARHLLGVVADTTAVSRVLNPLFLARLLL